MTLFPKWISEFRFIPSGEMAVCARVKVLEGVAAGEHSERSFVLDLARAEYCHHHDTSCKTRNGLGTAQRQEGKAGGLARYGRLWQVRRGHRPSGDLRVDP